MRVIVFVTKKLYQKTHLFNSIFYLKYSDPLLFFFDQRFILTLCAGLQCLYEKHLFLAQGNRASYYQTIRNSLERMLCYAMHALKRQISKFKFILDLPVLL